MTAALRKLVGAEAVGLRPGETIEAAGRARTVRGTESAEMFPPSTIWALSTQRLFVFASGSGRGANQLARPLLTLELGGAVTGARVEPFDDRDVLLVVQAGEHPAMVLMTPDDANEIVAGIEAALDLGGTVEDDQPNVSGTAGKLVDASSGDGDLEEGSREVAEFRRALVAGDWERAKSLLDESDDAAVREYFVDHVRGDDLVGGVEAWVGADPESPDPYLVRGGLAVARAFAQRREGGDDGQFHEELRDAERDLWWAVESDFSDAAPFTPLIWSGLALGVSLEELCMRYDESVRRCPDLLGAHVATLVALSPMGSGSEGDMFAFARTVARAAPEGSHLHALVPLAHLLAAESQRERRHYFSGEPATEIDFFAMMSVSSGSWKPRPTEMEAVNIFAAAFAKCGDFDRARAVMDENGAPRTRRPWSLLADADDLYRSIRADPA